MYERWTTVSTDGLETVVIRRDSDGACIPQDEGNKDYLEFLEWVAEGNTPTEREG